MPLQSSYAYSPYGETVTLGPDEGNTLQYTGRENDGTGLYYYRARYYDPGLKRFVSEDPIGLAGGDVSLYAYVGGNPVLSNDPLGLMGKGSGASSQGHWADCSPADWKFCERQCGSRGVKSCKHWISIHTELINGKIIRGPKSAPEPSCNCCEDPDPSPSPAPAPSKGDDPFDILMGNDKAKKSKSIFGPFPVFPRPLPIP